MTNENETVFPSKIDWWIGMILVGAPFIHLPLGVWMMVKGMPLFGFVLIFWGLIIASVIAALNFPCRYIVSASTLTIRSGMVTDSISLSRIVDVQPKRTLEMAPALSLDRIEIKLKDDTKRVISPVDQDRFISCLRKAA